MVAVEEIIPQITAEDIVLTMTHQDIVAFAAVNRIVAIASFYRVVAQVAIQEVVATDAINLVIAIQTEDIVGGFISYQFVNFWGAHDGFARDDDLTADDVQLSVAVGGVDEEFKGSCGGVWDIQENSPVSGLRVAPSGPSTRV